MTKRTEKDLNGAVLSEETFSYDKASNLTNANGTAFTYGTGNRLTLYNSHTVSYDLDGNMLSDGSMTYEYDSANRLIKAGDNEYTYNAEDVRIRNLCGEYDTTYVYDTNVKLSRLLQKTTNGVTTKYVYGLGLIGQEKEYCFRTYHFDYRGSTVAITDMYGNVTDRFEYDTYGKVISHTGNSFVVFGFNGRDGVITDKNGLLYMRARYYNPTLCRFVNADIISGEISDSTSLNRYAYANGNPISNIDPFGLSAERYTGESYQQTEKYSEKLEDVLSLLFVSEYEKFKGKVKWTMSKIINPFVNFGKDFLEKINFTHTEGLTGSISLGIINVSGTPCISIDTKGNIAIQASFSWSFSTGGGFGASVGISKMHTTAPSVKNLEGEGGFAGGSAIIPVYGIPVLVGGDVIIIPDSENGKTYFGNSSVIGVSTPGTPEGHAGISYTVPITDINLFDVYDNIYNAIMEW